MMKLDFKKYVYSPYGSWFVAKPKGSDRVTIDDLHGWTGSSNAVLSIESDDTSSIEFSPYSLTYRKVGEHKMVFSSENEIVLKGNGTNSFHYVLKADMDRFNGNPYDAVFATTISNNILINDFKNSKYLYLVPIRGELTLDAHIIDGEVVPDRVDVHVSPDRDGVYEVAILSTIPGDYKIPQVNFDFDSLEFANKQSFEEMHNLYRDIQDSIEAVYTMWSNFESQCGYFTQDTMICSKAGMCAIWSWDNCFQALAMARRLPQKAFYEFMLPYLYLREDGYMFDYVIDGHIAWQYTKPPVHGYIYKLMMRENEYFSRPEQLKQVLEPMVKNTNWWLTARGVPTYMHGNDSGADNATCFDKYMVVTSPDLYAYLAVQCDVISEIMSIIGDDREVEYRELAVQLASKIDEFLIDGKLHVQSRVTGEYVATDSLVTYKSIIATDMLSDAVKKVVVDIIPRYETKYGLASEPLDSDKYVTNGYWRGAIWAPDQALVITALDTMGYTDYARKLARTYVDAVKHSGCSENVDAVTGEGIRCPMYGWTAGVYIYLSDYLNK